MESTQQSEGDGKEMKVKVYSRGETEFHLDGEYQEPAIREAIEDGCNDVASQIIDYTDSERSNISHDSYAVVTEGDGTELWRGWLDGGDAPAPDGEAPKPQPAKVIVVRGEAGTPDSRTYSGPADGATPGQAALLAYERALGGQTGSWKYLGPAGRAAWEAAAQAGIDAFLAGDSVSAGSIREALAAQEPHAAPELAAAMVEARGYRDALQLIRGRENDPIAQVRHVARIAKRALGGKP